MAPLGNPYYMTERNLAEEGEGYSQIMADSKVKKVTLRDVLATQTKSVNYAKRKNCLVKVKYVVTTTNMHSQVQHPRSDLIIEKATNAKVASQPAAVKAMFEAKLPISSSHHWV